MKCHLYLFTKTFLATSSLSWNDGHTESDFSFPTPYFNRKCTINAILWNQNDPHFKAFFYCKGTHKHRSKILGKSITYFQLNHSFLGLINSNQGNSSSKPGCWCEQFLKKLSAEKHWVNVLCALCFSPLFVCYGLEDYYRTSKSSNSLKQGGKCLFLFFKKQKLNSQCSSALYLWDSV